MWPPGAPEDPDLLADKLKFTPQVGMKAKEKQHSFTDWLCSIKKNKTKKRSHNLTRKILLALGMFIIKGIPPMHSDWPAVPLITDGKPLHDEMRLSALAQGS